MTGTSPFDLEPSVGTEPFQPATTMDGGEGAADDERGRTRRVFGAIAAPFAAPRFYYGCGFLLTTFALFAQFNPDFAHRVLGAENMGWPWEVFQGADGNFELGWTRPHGICVGLSLIAIAFLTAAFLPAGRSRGTWATIWGALAFVAFTPSGDELYILLFALTGTLTAGALLMRNPEGSSSRLVLLLVLCLLASLLFMPLPSSTLQAAGEDPTAYRCQAFGTIDSYIDLPVTLSSNEAYTYYVHPTLQSWLPRGFWLRLDVLLASIPQTMMLFVFALGVMGLLGCGRWTGHLAAFLMFAVVIGVVLAVYHHGRGQPYFLTLTPHQGGLEAAGYTLWSRHYAFILPFIGGLADLGRRRS